jgi:NAD(P)-dependent dehydrogenase (short-subunit alcohol dehydrogenase family)
MSFSLVLPASRGVGFTMARQVLKSTDLPVVATARRDLNDARDRILDGTDVSKDRLRMVEIDVTDEKSIERAADTVKDMFDSPLLRLAMVMPGILPVSEKTPENIDLDLTLATYRVNTFGPLLVIKHFFPMLPSKKDKLEPAKGLPDFAVWANMSARIGSISDNRLGGWFTPRSSKAALNQITKSFDNYLQGKNKQGAIAIGLHPGTVKTDFSKAYWATNTTMVSPEEAAENLMNVISGLKLEMRGRCWDYKNEEILP